MYDILSGDRFGARSVEDLATVSDAEWKRLIEPVLGVLPLRQLRQRIATATQQTGAVVVAGGGVAHIGAIGLHAQSHTHHHYTEAELKAEPYNFTSIIDSKLSDIKMESFGREWLYDRLYEWITPAAPPQTQSQSQSQSQSQQQPKSLQSKILLITGEPVRSSARSDPI